VSRDWRLYVDDMLEGCRKVQRYTDGMTAVRWNTAANTAPGPTSWSLPGIRHCLRAAWL
jgi:hypothetical protein